MNMISFHKPFQTIPLTPQSFLQRIFKQDAVENAIIELNNLLAINAIKEIKQSDIEEIERRYGTSFIKNFRLNLEEFYATYLNYCLIDRTLSDEEISDLKHLKSLFQFEDRTVELLHIKIGEKIYRKSFSEAVSDGRLSSNELAFLEKLEQDLKLPKKLAEKISAEVRTNYFSNYVATATADMRLSPDEEDEMEAIAKSLDINVKVENKTQMQLLQLKKYWALENLDIPSVQNNLALQKGEKCYMNIRNVSWNELRTVRRNIGYSGLSTSFRVAKGVYLTSGSYTARTITSDQMTQLDTGSVYLTNKRLIFSGNRRNITVRLDKVLYITPYKDGVEIEKDSGKTPFLKFTEEIDSFCIIIERLLREKN